MYIFELRDPENLKINTKIVVLASLEPVKSCLRSRNLDVQNHVTIEELAYVYLN